MKEQRLESKCSNQHHGALEKETDSNFNTVVAASVPSFVKWELYLLLRATTTLIYHIPLKQGKNKNTICAQAQNDKIRVNSESHIPYIQS